MSNKININATANTMKAGHRTVTFSAGVVQRADSEGIPATNDTDLRNYLYYPFNGKTTTGQALGISGYDDTFYQAEFKTPLMIDKIEVCLAREDNVTSVTMYVDYKDGSTDTFNITPSRTSGSYYSSYYAQLKTVNPNSAKKTYRIRMKGVSKDGRRCYWGLCYVTLYGDLSYAVMAKSEAPINLLDKTSITGITTEGIQPANTSRHVAFKVDDAWKKLTIASGGAATLTNLATQAITPESLISEGNTAAELANVTSVPGFVGKLVYPAVALYVSEEATAMPTFGLKVNTITDRNKNSITSPVYHISDTEITITNITVNKKIVGNAGINIVASIKNSSGWSFYADIENIINKKATDIKFIYTFYVKECNEKNSARLIDITVNYDQNNPVMTLTGTFKISPLILCINEKENGLTHYKFNYVGRDNNSTNSVRRCFAKSLYELPQKAGGGVN